MLVIVCLAAAPLMIPLLHAQSEGADDPYFIGIVGFELKMNSGGRRMTHSWSQKRLVQLGDGVSVALLKILSPDDLRNPERVREFVPIIQACFAQPSAISLEANRDPRVTLFLLDHLRQDIDDPEVRELIRQTEELVRQKTAG